MATLFTRILTGELPGRFVYRDEQTAAFLTIAPIRPGHTLVVPVLEIDSWLDLPPDVLEAVISTSRRVGAAVQRVFRPRRVAMMIVGLEVPHCHVHLLPIDDELQLNFALADKRPDPAALDDVAARLSDAIVRG
jgi:diadenosine tetraphosphate (Ap4A) HIT family hydrolase